MADQLRRLGVDVLTAREDAAAQLPDAALLPQAKGANDFVATGSMLTARVSHTATLLANGKVLVAGGSGDSGSLSSAELYDPATGLWSTTGSLTNGRFDHTATLLADGKVLVAGGWGDTLMDRLSSAELYDPATGLWSETGSLATGRAGHTATLLPNGKVLVAGSRNTMGNADDLSSTELYDPATGLWSTTGSLVTVRAVYSATLLANGQVLVVGGQPYELHNYPLQRGAVRPSDRAVEHDRLAGRRQEWWTYGDLAG